MADDPPYVMDLSDLTVDDGRLEEIERWADRRYRPLSLIDWSGLSAITVAMINGLFTGDRVGVHTADPGGGKTHAIVELAVAVARIGHRLLVVLRDLVQCDRVSQGIREEAAKRAPELLEKGKIVEIFGGRGVWDDEEGPGEGNGRYPIDENTSIIICTDAGLGRRSASRFMSGLWRAIDRRGRRDFTPFHIIVDECFELMRAMRVTIHLRRRFYVQAENDGSKSMGRAITDCPMQERSGNCGNCHLQEGGDVARFKSRVNRREFARPYRTEVDGQGQVLRPETGTIDIPLDAFDCTPAQPVDERQTVWVRGVQGFRWVEGEEESRWAMPGPASAELEPFKRDESGLPHPAETIGSIIGSYVAGGLYPVIVEDFASLDGKPLRRDELMALEDKDRERVRWPHAACEGPRLVTTDASLLENMRRYAGEHDTGILLAGSAWTTDNRQTLDDVLCGAATWTHHRDPLDRRIGQVAVVRMTDDCGLKSLVRPQSESGRGVLATIDLEAEDRHVAVYARTKAKARELYELVRAAHSTCGLVVVNDKYVTIGDYVLAEAGHRTRLAYCQATMAYGMNMEKLGAIFVDGRGYRPIPSFNPRVVSRMSYQESRAEDHFSNLEQIIGRLFRGDDKVGIVVLFQISDAVWAEVQKLESLVRRCRRPPVFAEGNDVEVVIDQGVRWVKKNGGRWPAACPARSRRRAPGRKKTGRETLRERAIAAKRAGQSWRAFAKKEHIHRQAKSVQEEIRKLFDETT